MVFPPMINKYAVKYLAALKTKCFLWKREMSFIVGCEMKQIPLSPRAFHLNKHAELCFPICPYTRSSVKMSDIIGREMK